MAGIEQFLARRLKLKINKAKSAVAKPSVHGGNKPRRRIAPQAIAASRAGSGNSRGAPEGRASRRSPRNCPSIWLDGGPNLASAKRRRCCAHLTSGSGDGCVPLPGSSGSMDADAFASCDTAVSARPWRRKPPAAHAAHGGSAIAKRSSSPCRMTSSERSASQLWWYPAVSLNSPNRRIRDPYVRWCGFRLKLNAARFCLDRSRLADLSRFAAVCQTSRN